MGKAKQYSCEHHKQPLTRSRTKSGIPNTGRIHRGYSIDGVENKMRTHKADKVSLVHFLNGYKTGSSISRICLIVYRKQCAIGLELPR